MKIARYDSVLNKLTRVEEKAKLCYNGQIYKGVTYAAFEGFRIFQEFCAETGEVFRRVNGTWEMLEDE